MKIGQKIYTIFGWVTLKGKKHSPIGNKVLWYGIDEQGKVHNIEDKILAEEPDDTAKVEKDNKEKATKKTASDISNLAKKDFNVSVKNFPEAEKLSGVLSDIKNAQEATTGAVKAIPKTIIPEIKIPDNKELYELWKDELLESLKIEIPKVDLEPVITAINKIKIPAIPKANDYTQLLKDIKKALPKEQDDSAIIEAIKNIPEFEIPEKFIIKDSIKVAVDRVAGGGGSGVGGLNTLQESYLKKVSDNIGNVDEIETKLDTIITALGGTTGVEDTPEFFEDTSFVTGDSPVSLDINTALGRNAKTGWVKNDGNGNFTISLSINGTNFGDEITMKTGEVFSFENLSVDTIRITWVADSAYRVSAV